MDHLHSNPREARPGRHNSSVVVDSILLAEARDSVVRLVGHNIPHEFEGARTAQLASCSVHSLDWVGSMALHLCALVGVPIAPAEDQVVVCIEVVTYL